MQAVLVAQFSNTSFCQWLMGPDRKQHIRLLQCGTAMLLVFCSVLNMVYLAATGLAPLGPVLWWALALMGGFAGFFYAIRSGYNLRFAEPSLTIAQMVYALCCSAAGYALAGAGRGGVFSILMVIFMFGMYSLTPLQVWRVGLFAVALMGLTMIGMSHASPNVYAPEVEVSHFIMIAVMVPAIAVLTGQLSRMRERLRRQKRDIAAALARIQDLATRDELTGLINRRHMGDLMAQEHQRCVRSGQVFCLVLISLDDYQQFSAQRGEAFGDALVQSAAREALGAIRISDLLSRWSGGEFLLMLSDTRCSQARLSLERLSERMARLHIDFNTPALEMRFSMGAAEHHAGETVADTVTRAAQALLSAQANESPRNTVMV